MDGSFSRSQRDVIILHEFPNEVRFPSSIYARAYVSWLLSHLDSHLTSFWLTQYYHYNESITSQGYRWDSKTSWCSIMHSWGARFKLLQCSSSPSRTFSSVGCFFVWPCWPHSIGPGVLRPRNELEVRVSCSVLHWAFRAIGICWWV